jgi:hypothetical protein
VQRYYYAYHRKYGSPQMDVTRVPVQEASVSDDGVRVALTLPPLQPGYVYDVQITGLRSKLGVSLVNNRLFYTLNNLPNDTLQAIR